MLGELVGKEETVLNFIEEEYRIVSRDGKAYIITCDYKHERLNIWIEDGIIIKVENG